MSIICHHHEPTWDGSHSRVLPYLESLGSNSPQVGLALSLSTFVSKSNHHGQNFKLSPSGPCSLTFGFSLWIEPPWFKLQAPPSFWNPLSFFFFSFFFLFICSIFSFFFELEVPSFVIVCGFGDLVDLGLGVWKMEFGYGFGVSKYKIFGLGFGFVSKLVYVWVRKILPLWCVCAYELMYSGTWICRRNDLLVFDLLSFLFS